MTDASGALQLEDEFFRATKWVIEPGASIPFHRHEYPYVVVPFVSGTMHAVGSDGSETAVVLEHGVAYSRPAGAEHTVENRGSTPLHFIEIESLQSL